jgi:hypothetical protein
MVVASLVRGNAAGLGLFVMQLHPGTRECHTGVSRGLVKCGSHVLAGTLSPDRFVLPLSWRVCISVRPPPHATVGFLGNLFSDATHGMHTCCIVARSRIQHLLRLHAVASAPSSNLHFLPDTSRTLNR